MSDDEIFVEALDCNERKLWDDQRFTAAHEAVWNLFKFKSWEIKPSVLHLHVHLEGLHRVSFDPESTEIEESVDQQTSMLLQWFELNRIDDDARIIPYHEIPSKYCWLKTDHRWSTRKNGQNFPQVGRMIYVSPAEGDAYYLRKVLTVATGATSFVDLRTWQGVTYDTFFEVCRARNLIMDNEDLKSAIEDAASIVGIYQLIQMFAVILMNAQPQDPIQLWIDTRHLFIDDMSHM